MNPTERLKYAQQTADPRWRTVLGMLAIDTSAKGVSVSVGKMADSFPVADFLDLIAPPPDDDLPELTAEERAATDALPPDFITRLLAGEMLEFDAAGKPLRWVKRTSPPDARPDADELERLRWNLAGCLTIAESQKPTTFNDEMALPALHAVNKLAALADAARLTREAVPEDDAEPVTDAWLESLGFRENEQDDGHCISDGRLTLNLHGNGDVLVEDCENSVWLGDRYTSRGHVRRLCAALGLRLAGPADANAAPEDDAEPVTPHRLIESLKFVCVNYGCYHAYQSPRAAEEDRNVYVCFIPGVVSTWHIAYSERSAINIPDQPTIGHVRRLCAALGIRLDSADANAGGA